MVINVAIISRICVVAGFLMIAFLQFRENSVAEVPSYRPSANLLNDYDFSEKMAPDLKDEFLNPLNYTLPLPVVNRSAPRKDSDWAATFLRLPKWSHGYNDCESANTEVSCYELVRAAKAVEKWEKQVKTRGTVGQVWVNISSVTDLADRISMLYHGLQFAIVTERDLVTDKNKFSPLKLPDAIRHSTKDEGGNLIMNDYTFACGDVSSRFPKVAISLPAWPQAVYTHNSAAEPIRELFGYHAAYFLGNYLFGTLEKPESKCYFEKNDQQAVEGWRWVQDKKMLVPKDFKKFLSRCGINDFSAAMVTNDPNAKESREEYRDLTVFDDEDDDSVVCGLRKLMSAKRIIQTFGSRLGFWATAMQGSAGGFVNGIDKICVNMSNSQQGSLWHTYCPPEKTWVYRSNTVFYVCGPTVKHAKLYLDYLLW